jgi:AraC-like DNA-binding protein
MGNTKSSVRLGWALNVVATCQRAIVGPIVPDPLRFAALFARLASELPEVKTPAERVFLADRLRDFADIGGRHFHTAFHLNVSNPPCRGTNLATALAIWSERSGSDPRGILRDWIGVYLDKFEEEHQWPVTLRAANLLRSAPQTAVGIDAVAKAVGCSRSVLTRGFRKELGVSFLEFRTLMRLQKAVELMTQTAWSIECIARLVGYDTPKPLYVAVKRYTAFTPSRIRRSAPEEVHAFLSNVIDGLAGLGPRAGANPLGDSEDHRSMSNTADRPKDRPLNSRKGT